MKNDISMMLATQLINIRTKDEKVKYAKKVLDNLASADPEELPGILEHISMAYLMGRAFRDLHTLKTPQSDRVMREVYKMAQEFNKQLKESQDEIYN